MSVPDAVLAQWLAEVRAAVERERQAAEVAKSERWRLLRRLFRQWQERRR